MALSPFNSRLHVFNCIRREGTISRVELVEATGLSAGSISNITRELLDHGILDEVRTAAEGRGRPRLALSVNTEAATFAGMLLYPTGMVHVQITNMVGKVLHSGRYPISPFLEWDALADALADTLRRAVGETSWTLARPVAAGVGFFGTVGTDTGVLHWLPPAPPCPVPMQALLEERLAIPVFIDNDANIIARSECWRVPEEASGKRHFIHVGLGMGLSTTWDGAIQNGGRGVNPEFGHVKTSFAAGLPCLCGATGCLVTVCSIGGIVARAEVDMPPELGDLNDVLPRFAALAERARQGDASIQRLFDEAGSALGLSLANMVNVSNPEAATIIVEHEDWIERCSAAFYRTVQANLLGFLGQDFPITMRPDNPDLHPLGAIAMVQERLFQSETLPDWS